MQCSAIERKGITIEPDPDNGGLILPEGFRALVVADSVGPTRHIAVNSNGDVFAKLRITRGELGNVAMRDTNSDGRVDIFQRFGDYPNDGSFATEMRIHNGYLYYSSERIVYRQKLSVVNLIPDGKPEILVVDHHPLQWHNAKSLAFDDSGGMYVTFSAPTNACEDWQSVSGASQSSAGVKGINPCPQLVEQAGIWRFSDSRLNQTQIDGKKYATGLRSVVGITWFNDKLYAVLHGRDYLSQHAPQYFTEWDNAILPGEEFIDLEEGDDIGWPYAYYDHYQGKRILAPEYGGDGTKEVHGFKDPIMAFPAHWAPNDLLFYSGNQFPTRYQKGAFVAFHGSTNRNPYPQGGYIVAFVPFKNGKLSKSWELFADGFVGKDTIYQMQEATYRPMGLAEGPDGSLYISESKSGKIWRVFFSGDYEEFGDKQLLIMEKIKKTKSYLNDPERINNN